MNYEVDHSSNFFVPPIVQSFVITSVAPSIWEDIFSQNYKSKALILIYSSSYPQPLFSCAQILKFWHLFYL